MHTRTHKEVSGGVGRASKKTKFEECVVYKLRVARIDGKREKPFFFSGTYNIIADLAEGGWETFLKQNNTGILKLHS